MTLSGLLFTGVEVCVLEPFGMKMHIDMLEQLAEMQVDEPNVKESVDIGILCPLFGHSIVHMHESWSPTVHGGIREWFCDLGERSQLGDQSKDRHLPHTESPYREPPMLSQRQ